MKIYIGQQRADYLPLTRPRLCDEKPAVFDYTDIYPFPYQSQNASITYPFLDQLYEQFADNRVKVSGNVGLIYVSVTGKQNGVLFEENYVKKFYHREITGRLWSAIQVTTACGLCAVADLILQSSLPPKGFVTQEGIKYKDFLQNRFGRYYE